MLTITVLAENSDGKGLCGEHGLSLHIEYEGRRYLLDAGATGLFAENAAKLGLSLTEVEAMRKAPIMIPGANRVIMEHTARSRKDGSPVSRCSAARSRAKHAP